MTTRQEEIKNVNVEEAIENMKFFWNGIKLHKGGKLYKGRFQRNNGTFSFYAKGYDLAPAEVCAVFEVINNSDSMTDYFEHSHFYVDENHPCFEAVKAAIEKHEASRAKQAAKAAAKAEENTDTDTDTEETVTNSLAAEIVNFDGKAVEEKPVSARQARMIAYRACAANIRINIEWMMKDYPQDELSRKRISEEISALAQYCENQGRRIEASLEKAAAKKGAK